MYEEGWSNSMSFFPSVGRKVRGVGVGRRDLRLLWEGAIKCAVGLGKENQIELHHPSFTSSFSFYR